MGQAQNLFEDLETFVTSELSDVERQHFLGTTIKRIAGLAGRLKEFRPANGLRFSLQQQFGTMELQHIFVSSLLANAFLSTFPNRNINTHPTLQNFNFTFFFKGLKDRSVSRCPIDDGLLIFHIHLLLQPPSKGETEESFVLL